MANKIVQSAKDKVAEIKDGIRAGNEDLRKVREVRPDLFKKQKR